MHTSRVMALLVLLLAFCGAGRSQHVSTWLMPGDTLHHYNCQTNSGNIEMQPDQCFVNEDFEAWAVIHTNGIQATVSLSALAWIGDETQVISGSLKVYADTTEVYSHAIGSDMLTQTLNLTCDSVVAHVRFNQYHFALPNQWQRYFGLNWTTVTQANIDCGNTVVWINSVVPHDTAATVDWYGGGGRPVWVICNGQRHLATGNQYTVTGLQPSTAYTVSICDTARYGQRCCWGNYSFITLPGACVGVPDVTDLHSYYVQGYYGIYYMPTRYIGIMDYGPWSISSRHTIHTDTTETDPRTGGLLRTVFPGATATVRLGNWNSGGQAEAIAYRMHVDTAFYDILLLHYAVVMENPHHQSYEQPRFRLEILDPSGQVIDPVCGMADFVSNSNLEWNVFSSEIPVLWKNWTTIGFDLSAYQGQDVTLRFTTYDCSQGGHFGYAYFCADFIHKNVSSTHCGNSSSNTVTAPDGFLYRWYYQDSSQVFSTSRTVTYQTDESYLHCRLVSTEDSSCHVTLTTYMGPRFPLAVIDTLPPDDLGCDGYRVIFINRSTVTGEDNAPLDYPEHCETALWLFGDSTQSSDYSPQHTYYDSGSYTVTLVAGIANGLCLDTAQITLTVPDRYVSADEVIAACDSLRWRDSVWYRADTVGPSRREHNPAGCDTVHRLNLAILHSSVTLLPADTFCYSALYTWRGFTVGQQGDTLVADAHLLLADTLSDNRVCDSVLLLPLLQLAPDRALLAAEPNCGEKHYLLQSSSERPFLRWSSEPHDTCLDRHESDPQLLVYPTEPTLYTLVTDWRDTAYCPTTQHLALQPVAFPHAALGVIPAQLTCDKPDLTAYDIGTDYASRRWLVVAHYPGPLHDTVALAETGSVLVYSAMAGIDSLTVLLVADNSACLDTARTTLPLLCQTVYAPNVFTPGEGANRRFRIAGIGLQEPELTIYNREGLLVFSTADLEQGWDGTHSGTPCPQGAYVWHLHYLGIDGWHTAVGTVTLLR